MTANSIFSALFSLDAVYILTGATLFVFAGFNFKDRSRPHHTSSALFWLILGIIFAAGSFLPHVVTGLLVLTMVAIDGAGGVRQQAGGDANSEPVDETVARETAGITADTHAERLETAHTPAPHVARSRLSHVGGRIFLPVLAIPLVTILFALTAKAFGADVNRGALVGLGFGGIAAAGIALFVTRSDVGTLMREGRELNDRVGAISILPQLLASLGVIFAASRLGDLIAAGITGVVPPGNLFLLVVANCLGMAAFTMVMGNSFAAFPVIAAGVLVPLIIVPFGADPAAVAIITLTAGSTGTLMTPMAANFNIVPTALLDMRDRFGVIKFQVPFALAIWTLHVALMYLLIKFF